MSEELYKVWRPTEFDEMVGNQSTIKSIEKAIETESLPHLIMISGPSGCGKTTLGRIIRDKLDCSEFDYQEVNCAVNGGVDFARDVTKSMSYKPMSGKVKIWFMDECHKLTPAAINAYLKPFEDTPEWVYFIVATSEPEQLKKNKTGEALLTRSTHYKVSALEEDEIVDLVKDIANEEDVEVPDKIIEKIAEASGGSSRLALVLLQQILHLTSEEMSEQIETMIAKESNIYELFCLLMQWKSKKNWKAVIKSIKLIKEDDEGIRRALLTMASNQLLKENPKNWPQAYNIINCLSAPTYNTGKAGLVAGCYEALFGE
jgi:DNA polymerase-3 subunit gamma/tau